MKYNLSKWNILLNKELYILNIIFKKHSLAVAISWTLLKKILYDVAFIWRPMIG